MWREILASSLLLLGGDDDIDTLQNSLKREGYSESKLERLVEGYEPDHTVIHLYHNNPEKDGAQGKLTYEEYKEKLGMKYLKQNIHTYKQENLEALEDAEETYDVDYRYILSIIGIESAFGENLGNFNILNSLLTIYDEVPRKRQFAKNQIECLLETKNSVEEIKEIEGSYMSAFGYAMFIPCSEKKLAKGDLFSWNGAIKSIGNYLNHHGWSQEINGRRLKEEILTAPGDTLSKHMILKEYNKSNYYARAVDELAQHIPKHH